MSAQGENTLGTAPSYLWALLLDSPEGHSLCPPRAWPLRKGGRAAHLPFLCLHPVSLGCRSRQGQPGSAGPGRARWCPSPTVLLTQPRLCRLPSSLQPCVLLPRILGWAGMLWGPLALHPHPSGSSSFTSSCSLGSRSQAAAAFATSELAIFCPSPYSLGFVGMGERQGARAATGGATGRCWIMCLFFNSMKKPTSEIPFLFFLDPGAQLLPVTQWEAPRAPGSQKRLDGAFFPCTLEQLVRPRTLVPCSAW